jgi:NAD(P)-dependent dehydrogenase (short-subunit alcohol dehydrogenase family)
MNTLLITGASAGIGAATARRFLEADWAVVNLSRRPCPVEGVTHLPCDLTNPELADALAPALTPHLEAATRLVLVHNAARMDSDTAQNTDAAALRDILEINVVAPTTLNRLCVPYMKSGSAIVYVGSTLSEKAVPGSYSYVSTKHAMVGMMRATCQDLADTGIHTVCVCPGFTDTEMLRNHVPAEAMDSIRAMSAYQRLIDPAEIAETIHFAAENPVINGAVIHANLGQVER